MFCLHFKFYLNNFFFKWSNIDNKNYILKNFLSINKSNIIFRNNGLNKKYIYFLTKFKNNNYYIFNNFNFILLKNFSLILKNLIFNEKKFLFFSTNEKLFIPYYNNVFSSDDIYLYKNFIFYNTEFITYNNWLYFFKSFLKKLNIKVVLFLNQSSILKFIKLYSNINVIKMALLDDSLKNVYFDYYYFCNKSDILLLNFLLSNFIISTFFHYLVIKLYKNKYIFLKKYSIFFKKKMLYL